MQEKGYYKVRYKGNHGDLLWIGPLDDSDPEKMRELAKEAIGIGYIVDILDISPFQKSAVRDYSGKAYVTGPAKDVETEADFGVQISHPDPPTDWVHKYYPQK